MIKFVNGNMLETSADIRVNTVNCVGIMGAGVALIFKKQFPDMFKEYQEECKRGNVRPGKPHVWGENLLEGKTTIVNFPTKDHWRQPSKYEYIEAGLKWLRNFLYEQGKITVTIPALGCGHGGLDWVKVRQLITDYLGDLEAEIFVFSPKDTHMLDSSNDTLITAELTNQGVIVIHPSDAEYPDYFRGKSSLPLYVKGDPSIIKSGGLFILPSRKIEAREKEAFLLCLDYLKASDMPVVLGYSEGDRFIARELMQSKCKLIICLDEGILNFKIKKDIEDCWNDSITVISIFKPDQKWARYNLQKSLELKIVLGSNTLISAENPNWLVNTQQNIHNLLSNCFYINYRTNSANMLGFYSSINAIPISKDSDGKPKLQQLLNHI